MRRLLLSAAMALLLALAAPGPAHAAEGATLGAVGWWTSIPVMSAPDGGFAVGQGASGPTAVAAMRLTVDEEPPTTATLTITEADAVGTAALQVCPTPNEWEAVAAGAMDDAPKPECGTGSVPLERADDGSWTANVASLLDGTDVSLMVVPVEPAPDEPPAPPFQVSFDPPELSAPAAAGGGSTSPSTTAATTPAPSATPAFAPPPTPEVAAPSTVPVAGGAASADTGGDEVAISPSVTVPTSASSGPGEPRPWGQTAFFVVAATIIGVAAGVGRNQLRTRLNA